jgi:hypothetical protein
MGEKDMQTMPIARLSLGFMMCKLTVLTAKENKIRAEYLIKRKIDNFGYLFNT